jgi:hypothetical protein
MRPMSERAYILAELAEWHDESQDPSSDVAAAELIALAQLKGAPEELQSRAARILCPQFFT